jgi:preprotein translocase subunit SecA
MSGRPSFRPSTGSRSLRFPHTHQPSGRVGWPGRVYATADVRDGAVIESARHLSAQGRAVLIGTRSGFASEQTGRRLNEEGVVARVLNARQDDDEATIVAGAGEPGCITVATNMAGRGTDISLSDAVTESGGLHVIVIETNDSGRVGRQLIGRCARQGDPGSYQVFSSLDDEILALYYPRFVTKFFAFLPRRAGLLPQFLGQCII